MTDQRLTEILASRVMGWKPVADRFLKSGREWIPKWRFAPLNRLEDAFHVVDRAADRYILTNDSQVFTAEVHVGARIGRASGKSRARTITLAVAQALGLGVKL